MRMVYVLYYLIIRGLEEIVNISVSDRGHYSIVTQS